jgi:hypothetical protein
MTPEKLHLLREWIQSEIQFHHDSNTIFDGYDWSIDSKKKSDALFLKVCQLFCGVD